MSGVNAISSSSPAFCGSSESAKKTAKRAESKAASPIAAHIKQGIMDKYGLKSEKEIKPYLVTDYIADKATKAAVLIGGTALIFARARKSTNGLTEAVKDTFSKSKVSGTDAGKLLNRLKEVRKQVASNNLEVKQQALKGSGKSVIESVKDALLTPAKKFDKGSKLGGIIDSSTGSIKKVTNKLGISFDDAGAAKTIKSGLAKVGIGNDSQLIDTVVAAGGTALASTAGMDIATDATRANDSELADKAKTETKKERIVKGAKTVEKTINDGLNLLDKLQGAAATIGI